MGDETGRVVGGELGAETAAIDRGCQAAHNCDTEGAPTSRIVSLTALPALAWWAGTVVMIVELAGAITRPMPAPMIATARAKAG